ncbi:MAG: hypothetical protein ACYS1A_17310 [Planctomycetota bacterium]|jgi:hypothetical protein
MKRNKLFWIRRITLALFFFGLVAGVLRYDGLAVFLAIVIVGDILSDAIAGLKSN